MSITIIINLFLHCSDEVGALYTNLYPTVKEVYLKLLSLGLRVLVYNGDTDMACNFLGDQWFVEDLGFKVGTSILGKIIKIYTNYNQIHFLILLIHVVCRQPLSINTGFMMTRSLVSTNSLETSLS